MATRVVLIDDNPQDRFLAKRALTAEFSDLEVSEVRDQAEFEAVLRRKADIIVTDYQLRWSDGLKVLEAARAGGSDIPVVMFTHTGSEEIAAAGLRAGLADYIVKSPTHYRRLAHAVHIAIRNAVAARNEREARERERQALRTAEEALRVKDEFLATLSHELRTPLNAISGWVQIIKSIPEPDRIARGLTAIERNTAALQRLIEDLVDVSRMVTGQIALQVRPIDARQVVDAALDSVRPTAQGKSITIEVVAPPALEPIAGDPDRLQQIVWNLLSNAVKFTPEGGRVVLNLRTVESTIELKVTDTGPGIRTDFLPRVFEAFSQQDPSTTRAHGGLGLGLAIVRHLVAMHGGTVSVASAEGQGATFTVRLPVAQALVEGEAVSRSKGKGGRLDGVHALVVDDDADGREVIEQILEDEGAMVTAVSSAAEAFEALKRHQPHVVVCDIAMPIEDGLAFIRRVRAERHAEIASVPAVAVTAYARDHDRLRTLEAGFQFHLPKPVTAIELVDTVSFLTHRKTQKTL
jgi:signal transduction histidine kinase